ncbi:class I SAM-dependent methyltransferase [Spirosoma arcticum]
MTDNTHRFSDRVANYVRYRPGYPPQLLDFFRNTLGLQPNAHVADIGSGTGKLTELFLSAGYVVAGVEPNDEMRAAAEDLLAQYPTFISVNGTAEETTLPDHSADLILAGQAFHWFDRARAGAEFRRVLKPGGWAALIWNERSEASPFLRDYDQFLHQFSTDYADVHHRHIDRAVFDEFFGAEQYQTATFANHQDFDFTGLTGRYLSSSYSYAETHPAHADAIRELRRLFNNHQQNGLIRFEYKTVVYAGRW